MVHEALIGRADVLGRIGDLLTGSPMRPGPACTVVGEPGSGRTAVLAAAGRMADPRSLVLRAAGDPAETSLPLAGLHQLLHHPDSPGAPDGRGEVGPRLVDLLEDLARSHPVVLLVDDLHLWDEESRRALNFASRRLHGDVTIIATALRCTTRAIGDVIELDPLGDQDARRLLRERDLRPAAGVEDRIVDAARGHPLALVELARALTAPQRLGLDPLPDPWPVSPALRRLAAPFPELPEQTRRALALLAAEATGDPSLVAEALTRMGLAETDLEPAEEAGLIALSRGSWTFAHPVVGLTALASTPAPTLRAAHASLAQLTTGATRAWHRHAAVTRPDPGIGDDLAQAARRAESDGRWLETGRLWEAAADHADTPSSRYERQEHAVEAHLVAGQHGRASAMLGSLVRDAPDHATRARWQGRQVELEMLHDVAARPEYGELVNLAASIISGPDDRVTADLLATAALVCDVLCVERPQELVGMLGDDPTDRAPIRIVADALRGTPGSADLLTGTWIDQLELPLPVTDLGSILLAGITLLWLDRVADCERLVARLRELDSKTPGLEAVAGRLAGLCAVRRGAWEVADDVLAAAASAAHRDELALILGSILLDQAQLAAFRGDTASASATAEQAERILGPLPWAGYAIGLVRATLDVNAGDYASAAERYADAEALELRHPFGGPSMNYRFGEHVAALMRLGRAAEARDVAARYRSFTSNYDSATAAGALAQAEATISGAPDDFAQAVERLSIATNALDEARCRLVWGESLRRRRRRRDAVEQLHRARDTFVEIGAEPLVKRADAELAACGVQRVADPVAPALAVLTPREHEIVRLAAGGLSNAGIAERLFVSDRTVGYHLQNAYRKLGVRGRGDLAAFFT